MASSPLVLPGVLFVGEDERQRLTAHTGPAAGWMRPRGILEWSTEVSVVVREAMTEEVRRETKAVMPEEQIPPARFPLTLEAAKRSPLVAVSSRLTSKLVEQNVRVHTIGVDRMTSSFFYIAEGGGEEAMTVSGDLVQAVAEMLGERADNAAIERVLDSLVDRLLRSLSKDRVTELGVELAAALPRAAADGSGAQGIDLEAFEKDLAALVAASEKYAAPMQEIADKLAGSPDRKVDVPLWGDARKVPQGPFDLTVGDRKVTLGTYERWVMSGPFTEPSAAKPAPAPAPAAKPAPSPKPAEAKPASSPKPAEPALRSPTPAPAKAAALAAPIAPRPASDRPPPPRPATKSRPESGEIEAPVVAKAAEPPKVEEKKPEEKKPEPEPKKAEPEAEAKKPEPEAKKEPEGKKEPEPEPKKKAEPEAKKEEAAAKKAEAKKEEAAPESRAVEKKKADAAEKKAEEPAKGGFPWLAIIIAIAVAIVVYQVFLSKK